MKLLEVKMKNFGKFTGKTISFQDGINVLYGENESGKTTLYTFLKSMLFGLEKKRGRASANSEFQKYEPWDNPNYYAGVLRFQCGDRHFRLERSFDKYSKDASLLCEDDGEELSLEQGDLEMLLDGLTVEGYEETVAIGQLKVETAQSLAAKLQDYATNYYSTGNGEIHLEAALQYLKEKKKGVEKKFREELIQMDRKREKVTLESSYIWRDIHKLEQKLEAIEEQIIEQQKRKQAVLEKPRWRVHPLTILSILCILGMIFVFVPHPWNFLLMIVGALATGIFIWNRMKDGKRKKNEVGEISQRISKLQWEMEHLQCELQEKQVEHSNLEEYLEELQEPSEKHLEWEKKKQALDLASNQLMELSLQMQQSLGINLNEKASEILSQITGGKYTKLLIDESLHMDLLTEQGKIALQQVSRGTIEQIYFALRMAAVSVLHEDDFPIILDDTFVFYDEVRLQHTLEWIAQNKKQVIIMTCQKREEEILKKSKIPYHKIEW